MENRQRPQRRKGVQAGRAVEPLGPAAAPHVPGSLSAFFPPSCTSGWFRIGWKEEVQERGEALCVVCGRKWSSGKPPFPLRGKQCFRLATSPRPRGAQSCPTLDVGSGCPSEGTERQRSSGFPEMAQLQWAENDLGPPTGGHNAAWPAPQDTARGTANALSREPGGRKPAAPHSRGPALLA